MSADRVIAERSAYFARPGRRALVILDLADLCGPTEGVVELPLWLYWSSPDHVFDLDKSQFLREMYETVLREASKPEDLTSFLDRETLVQIWPQLHLPKGVRQAWQELHPVLRDAREAVA